MSNDQKSELFDLAQYETDLPPATSLGELTLERVRKYKPAKYALAVQLLGEGLSQRQTARACQLSRNVVARIAECETDTIKPLNKETARLARRVARMSLERLEEEIDSVPLASLVIIFGVATDKAELLSGNATERIELIKEDFRDLDDLYRSLPGDNAIDITDVTGLSRGDVGSKEGARGGSAGAGEASGAGAGDESGEPGDASQGQTGGAGDV